jgi:hypothetical protein
VTSALSEAIAAQQRAEQEQTSRDLLRAIQRAFREALLALPAEEYDWFDVAGRDGRGSSRPRADGDEIGMAVPDAGAVEQETPAPQRQFFEFAGPLFSVRIAPTACVMAVGTERDFRAVPRDRARKLVEENLQFRWDVLEGGGQLTGNGNEIAHYMAPAEPALARLRVTATQGDVECSTEATVTITAMLLPEAREPGGLRQGLPDYTFQRAPGELWRSRFDAAQNLIVVNSGHRDFVYANRAKMLKLRYLTRLYSKEMVLKSFPGAAPEDLLERMIELALYTEEHLK